MHQQRQPVKSERYTRFGYFIGALLFHIIVLVMVATIVIWRAPKEQTDAVFHAATEVKIPPPPEPPTAGAAAQNPQMEPQTIVVPPVTPPATIVSTTSDFKMDTKAALDQAMDHMPMPSPQGAGLAQGSGGTTGAGTSSVFGSTSGSATQLVGYLFDLKQTSSRKPTGMTPGDYHQVLVKFVAEGWNESLLTPFYRSPKPLYSSAILIPTMSANLGPKAFGLEAEVEPSRWFVWYKGRVTAPSAGTYRFAGLCDDILLVRIDKRTVLDGSLQAVNNKPFDTPWGQGRVTRRGEEFTMAAGEAKDIDIIIGEQPGGVFHAELFILKNGDNYPKAAKGQPPLPLFKIGTGFKMPTGTLPPLDPNAPSWEGSAR